MEADGSNAQGQTGYNGDPFPGSTSTTALTDFTSPANSKISVTINSISTTINSNVLVTDISTSGTNMTADLSPHWWGTISSNTTWSGDIKVGGDVTVPSGTTLTIAAGTDVTFTAGSDDLGGSPYTNKCAIKVNGTLVAEGTSTNKITFQSDATSPEKGDWDGIIFWDSSVDASCKVNHAIIKHAQTGIHGFSATPAELNNNEISSCVYGIQGGFENPTIQNNTLTDNSYGLYLYNDEGTGNGIQNNTITDSATEGLYLSNCSIPIFGCNIVDNNRGVEIRGGTTSTLESCTVDSNDTWGIYAYGNSDFTLLSSRIANNTTYGIRMYDGTDPVMERYIRKSWMG